jgi:CubicO group peptidase (beta-lactamase class C family)
LKYSIPAKLCLFIVLAAACVPALARPAAKPAGGPDNAKIEAFLRDKMLELKIPGMQVAAIQHGKVVFRGAYGVAEVEHSVPVTDKTVWPIHSITKAFVGVAVMQLVEAGKLELDAPVARYLDDLPQDWRAVTIRQLLTHTSGLPDLRAFPADDSRMVDYDEGVTWAKMRAAPVLAAPGETFHYDTLNYILIGKIIDKLSGEPFTRYLAERQFKVAGMPSAVFGDANNVVPNLAGTYWYYRYVNYTRESSETLQIYDRQWPPYMWTAAGINVTLDDLARWSIALMQGKLLQPSSLKTLWKPGMLNNGKPGGFNDYINGYALGWPSVNRAKHNALACLGGGRAALFIYPDDDLTLIILTDLMGSGPEQLMDDLAAFYIPDMRSSN